MIALQRLNRGMLSRYEIPEHRPEAVRAVQFGAGEALLGVVDRLLDRRAPELGIACVADAASAARLAAQDGLFTVLERGYVNDVPVKRETVVQSVVEVVDPEADFAALTDLARRPELTLALLDADAPDAGVALGLAARLLAGRFEAGLPGLDVLCLGDDPACADRARAFIARVAAPWSLAGFGEWLEGSCPFHAALAEGFAFRPDAAEAARICAEMNYGDALLHAAEPFARLTVRGALPGVPAGEGIEDVEDIAPAFLRKHRVFDAALFALAAPGWLLGCDTLADCMKHERLRAFAGNTVYRELLPRLPMAREAAAGAVIEAFGRFENPLGGVPVLRAAHHLLRRFEAGVLPVLRASAEADYDVPEGLSFALAATLMLYAGARPGRTGETSPGKAVDPVEAAWDEAVGGTGSDGGAREEGEAAPAAPRYEVVRGERAEALRDDPDRLAVFATLSHDMPPEALAYAALADRELWRGADLREIDGLETRVTLALAAIQRDPLGLPAGD